MTVVRIRLDHVRLDISDVARSESYYASIFNLERVVEYNMTGRVILQMAQAGQPPAIELWWEQDVRPRPHPTQHVAFSVSDVHAVLERVKDGGHRVASGPRRIGEETVAIVLDPDGHLIEINDFQGRGSGEAGR
jgi:catechol 2,3-dioxygenase-like lactoylglutathione lyase family enzyme